MEDIVIVSAARKALERAGWKAADLDLMETMKRLRRKPARSISKWVGTLPNSTSMAVPLPLGARRGASGCRILVTLLHEMQRRDAKKGIASSCIGGGMGAALTIER
jgi:acetyl-CoA C-acetyltransferase